MKYVSYILSIVAIIAAIVSFSDFMNFITMQVEVSAPQQAGQMAQIIAQAAIPYFIARLWNDITGFNQTDKISALLKDLISKKSE